MNRLQSNGVDLNTLRQAKRDLYARNNQTLKDNDAADAEIVAEYVAQNLLTNELSIRNVAQQDPSLGRRILNWLNSLLSKLGGKDAQDAAFVRRARDLYSAALQQTKGSFTQDTLNAKPVWPASGTTREINTGDSLGAGDPQNDRGATVSQDASGLTENMDAAEMRQWALEAYNAGQISEQTLDQILDDIDVQEELDGSGDSLEAELNRLNQEPAAQHSISAVNNVIDLSKDSELSKRVAGVFGSAKYKIIQEYILDVLGDQTVTLSDGKDAIVDRSDALHIANKAADKKTAQISRIRELVETAELYAEDVHVKHDKFNYFCYYRADVKYDGKVFPVYLNVGRGINDGKYHIYDITNKIRDTADRINGLERPKPNEGYALTNGISIKSISDSDPNVNKQHSISAPAERQNIIRDLRSILDRGGDLNELRRYVTRLEQGTQTAGQTASVSSREGTEAQHSISEPPGSLSELSEKKRRALYNKKAIKLSGKDWAKLNSARTQRYASLDEADIPEIDIFYIAEYNKVNLGYSYVIRNYSEDSFSAISKKRIKPKIAEIADLEEQSYGRNEESQRTGENNVSKGSSERIGAGRSFNSGNRGELRENAGGVAAEGESNENLGHWKGNPNSGAGRGVNENADAQHSISPIVGQQADYGIGVVLDTPLFDGVKPRDWGKVLGNYVYQNLAGTELKVYDDAGNEETIYIAKTTDRVTKDGAKNSHKVIDKLARYRGDNIKALATVHLSELLQTAHQEKITTEHKHQWLDQNGWEYRKTYIQDAKGSIYEAWLNIAKGRERNILYDINNVRLIDKANNKRAAHGVVPSTDTGRGSHIKSSSSEEIVSETSSDVNGQHSISAPAERQSIIRDLRSILDRGGDPNELRRYVTQLEQGTQGAGQTASVSVRESTEAQRILQAARDRGIGVEEYLEQNWERYDVDGQWNDAARQALELEQGQSRRQHSISPTFASEIDQWDGKSEKTFQVGTTSDALKSIGIKDRGIIWHSQKIAKILQKHGAMTKDVIKQVPDILEHPVVVLASKQSASRLVIFGTVKDANGDPVTAILELQPTTKGGQLMDLSVIASAYGKEGNVARFVENSGLVYLDADRKRTEGWLQGLGLQLPSDTTAFGSIGRVTYPDGKVKIESVPYSQYMQNANDDSTSGQHSISDPSVGLETIEDTTAEKDLEDTDDIRSVLPKKARDYLKRTERTLLNGIGRNLGVPWFAQREYLQPLVEEISNEYLKNGTVSKETIDRLFDTAYDQGVVVDREFYDQYKDVKGYLRTTAVTLSESHREDIADFGDFRKRNFGTLLNMAKSFQADKLIYKCPYRFVTTGFRQL